MTAPVLVDEKTGMNKIVDAKVQAKIKEVLLSKTVNLDEHKPKEWDDKMKANVVKVLSIVSGNDSYVAEQKVNSAKNDSSKQNATSPIETAATDADDFFSLDSDDE